MCLCMDVLLMLGCGFVYMADKLDVLILILHWESMLSHAPQLVNEGH